MVSDSLKPHYDAVLKDIEAERAEVHKEVAALQRKLRELDYNLASLSRRLGLVPTFPALGPIATNPIQASILETSKYATVSTRWAILLELNKVNVSMSVQEIADAILAGGIRTRATNFANNVSAVLSDMKNGKDEVDVKDGKWFVTENGRGAADHIAGKLRRRSGRNERIEAPEI